MTDKSSTETQLDTFALAALLAVSFAAVPVLMWTTNSGLWFFS